MGPIDAVLSRKQRWISICKNATVREALTNFRTLIRLMGQRPTHCPELMVNMPGFVGFCDASKLGAGGVLLVGTLQLSPVVWRLEWPRDIQRKVVSFSNQAGTLTNSHLEMLACWWYTTWFWITLSHYATCTWQHGVTTHQP
jgi:hypothetical protein